jgi:hypothetical protein
MKINGYPSVRADTGRDSGNAILLSPRIFVFGGKAAIGFPLSALEGLAKIFLHGLLDTMLIAP